MVSIINDIDTTILYSILNKSFQQIFLLISYINTLSFNNIFIRIFILLGNGTDIYSLTICLLLLLHILNTDRFKFKIRYLWLLLIYLILIKAKYFLYCPNRMCHIWYKSCFMWRRYRNNSWHCLYWRLVRNGWFVCSDSCFVIILLLFLLLTFSKIY